MQLENFNQIDIAVYMVTYNHEEFIAQAIEGVIKQKTRYSFKLFIGEDCSTDNTKSICLGYQKKYPDLIEVTSTETNNLKQNVKNTFDKCFESTAKYVAMCEGDDYWIDPNKLQKQVDFLEENTTYSICFHKVYERSIDKIYISPDNPWEDEKTFTILDLGSKNFMHTASIVYRNRLFSKFPDWFNDSPVGDYVWNLFNAQHGLIKYLPEPMGVYRRFAGTWSSQSNELLLIRTTKVLDNLLTEDFEGDVKKVLANHRKNLVTQYCKLLLDRNDFSYLKVLEVELEKSPAIAKDWVFQHYPEKLRQIYNSKAYRIATTLSKLFSKLRK